MIKNDEILIKYDIITNSKWDAFVSRMKSEIDELNLTVNSEELENIKQDVEIYG